MSTNIYIIRHAEAEGNLWRRAHGWYDGDLTPNGEAQVSALEKRMTGENIDALYSSDLTRTMKTAGAVSRACSVDIIPEPRLREFAMGEWENAPWATLRRIEPAKLAEFAKTPRWRAPGAESMRELYERTGAALMGILEKHSGGSVCIVSHAIATRALFCRMLCDSAAHVGDRFGGMSYVPNASVSLFEYENGAFRQLYFADDAHTADVPTFRARVPDGCACKPELWFRSAYGAADVERAAGAWRESWLAVHGHDDDFSLSSARDELFRMLRGDAFAIRFAMLGEDEAGVLILDEGNLWEPGCGHISLVMLHERFRGCGLASQLIGEAAAVYLQKGRSFLRLRVAATNERALRIYRRNGFVVTDYESASDGGQYIMKRFIGKASERREPQGRLAGEGF